MEKKERKIMTPHDSLGDCVYIWQEQEKRGIEFVPLSPRNSSSSRQDEVPAVQKAM